MSRRMCAAILGCGLALTGSCSTSRAEDGITRSTITVGSVLALKGQAQGLGLLMKLGMEAAFRNEQVQGRTLIINAANDYYEPTEAAIETRRLIKEGVFVMIGNVGTPTAVVTLPILKTEGVPAVGFFTGAGILRPGAGGPIVNYRASYVEETVGVISEALSAGIGIDEVCAYVQNDAFGMAGLAGVKSALEARRGSPDSIRILDILLKMTGDNPDRNYKGPVGVYTRNDVEAKPGYYSLKAWEKATGTTCRLVVTVGAYAPIGEFIRLSRRSGEKWIVSAVSFTGADSLLDLLKQYHTMDRIVMSQVVPLLDSTRPIVLEAKQKLGYGFAFVSLEGYIVGRMFLQILRDIKGDITRDSFMKQVSVSKFNLGGIPIDFTHGNQGSSLIVVSFPTEAGYREVTHNYWQQMVR